MVFFHGSYLLKMSAWHQYQEEYDVESLDGTAINCESSASSAESSSSFSYFLPTIMLFSVFC